MVLWPLLTPAVSAWLLSQGYHFLQLDGRPPQVRALAFLAHLPDLLLWPLVASGFAVICQLARPHSLIRFVFLRSQVCLRLPPDPASRRRPCLWLAVGATNLRKGLSPSSQRPCWAHKSRGRSETCPYRKMLLQHLCRQRLQARHIVSEDAECLLHSHRGRKVDACQAQSIQRIARPPDLRKPR